MSSEKHIFVNKSEQIRRWGILSWKLWNSKRPLGEISMDRFEDNFVDIVTWFLKNKIIDYS